MSRPALKTGLRAGMLLLGGFAGFILLGRASAMPAAPSPALAQAASPRFTYASGFQGVGYYANPGTTTVARSAPAPRTTAARGSSVGPGTRDWSTGRRGRLHKPWLSPR
ncbi:hypothetical protein P12x_005152 [Tundrisphaera lichenicola]|uniref:hypothetical protein n=1 Tax=Tundrisphaera lichenicola TaxID=2029860 RepID=UPI003EBFD90E